MVIAVLSLTAFLTGIVSALVGMIGGGLLLSVMAVYLSPLALIPLHGVVQLSSNLSRTVIHRRSIRLDVVIPYAIGGALGSLLGSQVVLQVPENFLGLVIGVFLIAMAWWPLKKKSKSVDQKNYSFPKIGVPSFLKYFPMGFGLAFISLFLGAIGTILGAFFVREQMPKTVHLGTQAACQSLVHCFKILVFVGIGFSLAEYFPLLICMIAATVVGNKLGTRFLDKIPEKVFLRLIQVLVSVFGLRMLIESYKNFSI